MKRIVVDIDEKLHRDFKVYCYSEGRTIREVIVELMESKTKKKGGIKTYSSGKIKQHVILKKK